MAGRQWRATDPGIPEPLRIELVGVLMHARRRLARSAADRSPTDTATLRGRVHDAKVALGERGEPWWEDLDDDALFERATAIVRTLQRARSHSNVEPKEVSQVLSGRSWRSSIDLARRALRWADQGDPPRPTTNPTPRPFAGALATPSPCTARRSAAAWSRGDTSPSELTV